MAVSDNGCGLGCWGWGFIVLLVGSFFAALENGDWTFFLILIIPLLVGLVIAFMGMDQNKTDDSVEDFSATPPKSTSSQSLSITENSSKSLVNYDDILDDDDDDDLEDLNDDDDDWDDELDDDDDEEDVFDRTVDKTDYTVQVSSDEFRDIKHAVKQLLKICHLMSADREMRQYVFSQARDKNTIQGEYDMNQFFSTLSFLLAKDIIYIYEHLGYEADINLYEPEGQLLLAIIKTLNEEGEDNNFKTFKRLIKNDDGYTAAIRDNYEEMLEIFKSQKDVSISAKGIDDFSLVLIIKYSNQEKRYLKNTRTALYVLVKTIVDVSGHSKIAKAFLNEMIDRSMDDDEEAEQESAENAGIQTEPLATMDDLQSLIGLHQVKKEVSALKNFIEVSRRREQAGMKTPSVSYHCVFTGNPGTGKTTVARIVAGIYKELGVLKKGHLVETDRSGLVAEYVGQTAVKTNKVIDSALDGVLFIDEAYSLIGAGNEDFGKEAIATLVKRMEDDRDRLVVILAGYEKEMQDFINSNPGLRSRFNRYIHFEDYSAEELKQIYLGLLQKYDFVLQAEGEKVLTDHLEQCVANRGKDFGNARYVRNLFEHTIKAQSVRLAAQPESGTAELAMITADDIAVAIAEKP